MVPVAGSDQDVWKLLILRCLSLLYFDQSEAERVSLYIQFKKVASELRKKHIMAYNERHPKKYCLLLTKVNIKSMLCSFFSVLNDSSLLNCFQTSFYI